MNRANFGNVTTNAVQTVSVAGFTGSNWAKGADKAKLADASSALNNLSKEELNQIGKMRADKLRDEVKEYNSEKGKENLGENEELNVDNIMNDTTFKDMDTPQKQYINLKISKDVLYSEAMSRGPGGKFRKTTIEELLKQKGGNS